MSLVRGNTCEICASSCLISFTRLKYMSGSIHMGVLLLGSWYRGSSRCTKDRNSMSSTIDAGCISVAIISKELDQFACVAWNQLSTAVHSEEHPALCVAISITFLGCSSSFPCFLYCTRCLSFKCYRKKNNKKKTNKKKKKKKQEQQNKNNTNPKHPPPGSLPAPYNDKNTNTR